MVETAPLEVIQQKFEEKIARLLSETDSGGSLSSHAIEDLVENVVEDCSATVSLNYRSQSAEKIKADRSLTAGFEQRLLKRWEPAFDHLDMMWSVAADLGRLQSEEISNYEASWVGGALSQIFPRALLVTQEIMCLLKGGFPDGALARWRTLHELSVTMLYISKRGEEAAKEYLLSFPFSARRASHQINEHSERSGLSAIDVDQLNALDEQCRLAEVQLGRTINKDADGEWPKITRQHPNFAKMEEFVGMDHWRPRFKWASVHTHASHRLSDRLLGMSEAKEPVNLIGASNSGFVDPFQMTAISLNQAIATYLLLTPNLDRTVHCKVMTQFADEMAEIAIRAEEESKKDSGAGE